MTERGEGDTQFASWERIREAVSCCFGQTVPPMWKKPEISICAIDINCLGFSVAQANAKKLASEAANANASKNALEKATAGAREKAKERALALAKAEALKARDQALIQRVRDHALSMAKEQARTKATEDARVGSVVIMRVRR